MRQTFEHGKYAAPVSFDDVRAEWEREGFSFGVFRDPAGQEWNEFVHDVDEYVLVAEGTLSIDVGQETAEVAPGDLVCIPRGVSHSLKTTSPTGSVWLYGYGTWSE